MTPPAPPVLEKLEVVHEPSKALPGKDIVDSSKVVEEKPSELTVVMALEDAAPGKPQKPSNLEILETVAPVAEKGQRIPAIEDGDVGDEKSPDVTAIAANAMLEQALHQRDRDKQAPSKMKRPAACPLKRPAAAPKRKADETSDSVNAVGDIPVAKAAKTVPFPKAPPPQPKIGNKGPIPGEARRLQLMPNGCPKCRNRKGCTPSCWIQRGYRKRG